MASFRAPSAQLLRALKEVSTNGQSKTIGRSFSTGRALYAEVQDVKPSTESFYQNIDPATVYSPRLERRLIRAGKTPIGSRRRRAALASTPNIPFDELPYQCFQEARQILIADRAEKMGKIETERARIARLRETDSSTMAGGEAYKQKRLRSMQVTLEKLKILADLNDPNVKRRFEDGKGDMNKPIYRHLAERKWREYPRKILVQRITQMKVVPDVVPHLDPIVDVKIAFGSQRIPAGDFVDSKISQQPCDLIVQAFDRGEKLVTVAVVDPDVPNLDTDDFDMRCHFLATNIPISPTAPFIKLGALPSESHVLLPWLAPHALKGSPYHRLSIIILQHKNNIPIDVEVAMKNIQRDGFSARSMITRHMLTPIGGSLFRTKWDENMADVMARAGIEGSNIELKRKKVEPLPYKRRNPSTFR